MTEYEIMTISKQKLKQILNMKIQIKSKEYLENKRGSKGREIIYKNLEMAHYLLPNDCGLTVDMKQQIFAIRNRMLNIPYNFPGQYKQINDECKTGCGNLETMKHLYMCEQLNMKHRKYPYESIFSDNLYKQSEVLKIMQENIQIRNTY